MRELLIVIGSVGVLFALTATVCVPQNVVREDLTDKNFDVECDTAPRLGHQVSPTRHPKLVHIPPASLRIFNACSMGQGGFTQRDSICIDVTVNFPNIAATFSNVADSIVCVTLRTGNRGVTHKGCRIPRTGFGLWVITGRDTARFRVEPGRPPVVSYTDTTQHMLLAEVDTLPPNAFPIQLYGRDTKRWGEVISGLQDEFGDRVRIVTLDSGFYPCLMPTPTTSLLNIGRHRCANVNELGFVVCVQAVDTSVVTDLAKEFEKIGRVESAAAQKLKKR